MEYLSADDSETVFSESEINEEDPKRNTSRRKSSFVWRYFHPVDENSKSYQCLICNGCVGNQTSNLARHLAASHNITKQAEGRGRPSHSFIWKYCTKEDSKHARCHLCKNLLYFGGGNTTNISKHLRRRHLHIIQNLDRRMDSELGDNCTSTPKGEPANGSFQNGSFIQIKNFDIKASDTLSERKERKGSSYVWNFCDKLSRHTIRCRLCNKVMSFHGTANVITHLQRKHNIVGKVEGNTTSFGNACVKFNLSEDNSQLEQLEEHPTLKRGRGLPAASSIVWKYCTRIGKDVVRCGFCEKNLSYQGTSNLQRHLHRMHGVVTQGRIKNEHDESSLRYCDSNFISEHCTLTVDQKTKCNMCNLTFSSKDTDAIVKHLITTHTIIPRRTDGPQKRRIDLKNEESSDNFDDFDTDNWSKQDDQENSSDLQGLTIKKHETIFEDIIEEEHEETACDEDPFDLNVSEIGIQDLPLANPLSPQSSRAASPEIAPKVVINSKRLERLNEERLRMETEYFREKAGFYRMQKYLTALQAKKVRLEIDHLNNGEINGIYSDDIGMQPNLAPQ